MEALYFPFLQSDKASLDLLKKNFSKLFLLSLKEDFLSSEGISLLKPEGLDMERLEAFSFDLEKRAELLGREALFDFFEEKEEFSDSVQDLKLEISGEKKEAEKKDESGEEKLKAAFLLLQSEKLDTINKEVSKSLSRVDTAERELLSMLKGEEVKEEPCRDKFTSLELRHMRIRIRAWLKLLSFSPSVPRLWVSDLPFLADRIEDIFSGSFEKTVLSEEEAFSDLKLKGSLFKISLSFLDEFEGISFCDKKNLSFFWLLCL